jgi:hypothetical protein
VAAPITRYPASRQYFWSGLIALAIAIFSGWVAWRWPYAWISAGLALATAILLFLLASCPKIEVYESQLKLGRRSIPWLQIRKLDRVAVAPLIVRLTLVGGKRIFVIHAGDQDQSTSLLRQLRRYARESSIDGVPYRQFWGESAAPAAGERKASSPSKRPLLLAEDEAEVERLFQRLKAVGHIDPKSSDEK